MSKQIRAPLILFILALAGLGFWWVGDPQRYIASDGLTEGQRDKVMLIESLRVRADAAGVILETGYLESLCGSAREIEVVYAARDQAIDGESPTIAHVFHCERLAGQGKPGELMIARNDFLTASSAAERETATGTLRARLIFPGAPFPRKWMVQGISVRGESPFGISLFEIEKVRGSALELELDR